jgi:hypothetical protein
MNIVKTRSVDLKHQSGYLRLFLALFSAGIFFQPASVLAIPTSENFKLGNVNFGQEMFLTTTDYSNPTILGAGPEVTELTPYTAKIKWNTDKNSSSSIFYGTASGEYPFENSKAYENSVVHEIELVNLTPKTKYYFTAKSKDSFGNSGSSVEKNFTTPLPVPEITNIQIGEITENSAVVKFSSNFYTTAIVDYTNITSLEKNTAGESGFSKEHSIALKNLSDNQSYSILIVARDDEGHESIASSQTFTTLKDTVPPIIDNVKFDLNVISGKNKVRGTIAWATSEDSNSLIKYKESNNDSYTESPELTDLVKNHFLTLPDLKPSTTYKMIAISKDKSGNIGQSEEFVILTPKQKRTFLQIILENIQSIFAPFAKLFNG